MFFKVLLAQEFVIVTTASSLKRGAGIFLVNR